MASPAAPAASPAPAKARGSNPLVDLLATEDTHLAALHALVHNVARAWSRSRPPPRALDGMFRAVEGLSRAHRAFYNDLKAIGPRPASPKALGDLLMRWVDDLERPYTRFIAAYASPLDPLPGVADNPKLGALLADAAPLLPDSLDQAFALPLTRLAYYKRLYARLLRSTQPGRSDHRLLVAANGKLDALLESADRARQRDVGSSAPPVGSPEGDDRRTSNAASSRSAASAASSKDFVSPPGSAAHSSASSMSPPPLQPSSRAGSAGLKGAAGPGAPHSTHAPAPDAFPNPFPGPGPGLGPQHAEPPQLHSPDAASPSLGPLPNFGALSLDPPVTPNPESPAALAARLQSEFDTSSTLDLFTLQPKACALHLARPDLPFERCLRAATNVSIKLLPRPGSAAAGGRGAEWPNAHVVLLTDLFLVAVNMTPSQRAQQQAQGKHASRSLLFPPLTGRHLVLAPVPPQDQDKEAVALTVLGKETLLLSFGPRGDPLAAENAALWREQVQDCNNFASGRAGGARKPPVVAPGPSHPTGPMVPSSPSIPSSPSVRGPPLAPLAMPSISVHESHGPGSAQTPSPIPAHVGAVDRPESASTAASVASNHSFALVNPYDGPAPHRLPSPQLPTSPLGPMTGSPGPMSPIRPGQPIGFQAPPPLARAAGAGGPPFPPQMGLQPGMPFPPQRMVSSPTPAPGGLSPSFPPVSAARSAPSSPAVGAQTGPFPARQGPGLSPNPLDQQRPPMAPRSASFTAGAAARPPPQEDAAAGGVAMPSALLKSGQLAERGQASRDEMLAAASDELLPGERVSATAADDTAVASGGAGFKAARIVAQMRSKVFLRQGSGWKPLGQAQLQLYALVPKHGLRREHAARQLVAQGKSKTLISTLVLPDGGAHRMGRTGLAVECSHDGMRTGVVYLLQLRSESSADGLYAAIMEDAGKAP